MLTESQTAHTWIDLPAGSGDHEVSHAAQTIARDSQILAMHLARPDLPRAKVNALPKWRLRRVEQHVAVHFERSISLSELANVAGLSRMHFAAQFRAATGYRPREYLLNHRIEHAKSLLAATNRPLAEIALAVGFSTQAHFSTVFKRISGETPARWRSAFKNERPDFETRPRRRSSRDQDWAVRSPDIHATVVR